MSKEAFEKVANDLVTAVDEAFKKPAPLPAFILLYSSIDILASLSRPVVQEDTSGSIFKSWVKKYLIGNNAFTWNEEDIWGARCGLLHTFMIQSRSSRSGVARELSYSTNQEWAKLAQMLIDSKAQQKVIVYLPELTTAFVEGVGRFKLDVVSNSSLQATVFHHAAKLIFHQKKHLP